MPGDPWQAKLDAYVDGELPTAESQSLDAHLRECHDCAAELLQRVQLKLAVQTGGKRYSASSNLRERVQAAMPRAKSRAWTMRRFARLAAATALLALAFLAVHGWTSYQRERTLAELTDLHISTLASANPVDVVSTDRHTVKPWFQGKLPFTFNLPELQGSPFLLSGGRVAYLDQSPGAQLLFTLGNHRISVFVLQNKTSLLSAPGDNRSKYRTFSVESWTQDGLRYFIVSDANADDVHRLGELLRQAAR